MSEVPRIDFALARNHLVAAHRTVIRLPLLRIECVNAVMIRCQSIFQSDPSSQNNLIAVFLAARVSLEAILKKAHVQDFGCRILNSAAAMFPELFKLILMVKIQVAKGSDGFRTEYLGCCTGISKSLFEIPIIGGYAAHSTQQDLGKQGIRWDADTGRHISFCNALAKLHDAVSIILLREFLGRKVPEIIPLRLINQTDNIRMDLVILLHEERVSKHTPTGQIPSQVKAEIVDRGVNLRAPIQPKRFMAVLPREIPVMWIILHTVIALVSGMNGFSKFFLIHNTIGRLTMVRVALYFAFPEYDPLFL